jgi:MSHA biogenesis protein MshE
VYELLEIDYTLADALRRNDPSGFENAARNQDGYRPLIENALNYARHGLTSLSEAMRLSGAVD